MQRHESIVDDIVDVHGFLRQGSSVSCDVMGSGDSYTMHMT
jgi:hypothetical protein